MQNEVITDGCNVAECNYYFYEDVNKTHTCKLIQIDDKVHYICKDNPNCYFKQLQRMKAENEKLKEWLENKEKAYIELCNANSRKKEQIKNLNYMLFEEKEMTTQEWKLKYRLANKERKFIQYKDITNKRLNDYKQALEDIRDLNNKTVQIPIITDKINEVLDEK